MQNLEIEPAVSNGLYRNGGTRHELSYDKPPGGEWGWGNHTRIASYFKHQLKYVFVALHLPILVPNHTFPEKLLMTLMNFCVKYYINFHFSTSMIENVCIIYFHHFKIRIQSHILFSAFLFNDSQAFFFLYLTYLLLYLDLFENHIYHRNVDLIGIWQLKRAIFFTDVRKQIHDKYVHYLINTLTDFKNLIKSLLTFNKHLKLYKLGGRAERCGSEDIRLSAMPQTKFSI